MHTYSRTFDIDPKVAAAVKNGTAVMVVHGIDYNKNSLYDNALGMTSGVAAESASPGPVRRLRRVADGVSSDR